MQRRPELRQRRTLPNVQTRTNRQSYVCRAEAVSAGSLISRTEVPAFIQRDDLMDQMYRWALIEAAEHGQRKFGMPMSVEPFYENDTLWGYKVSIVKEGIKQTDIKITFDQEPVLKHEWVDRGEDGMPVVGGKAEEVKGKHFEIWKDDDKPVDEDLRATIRAFCTALAAAMNQYYSFGSVFAVDAQ